MDVMACCERTRRSSSSYSASLTPSTQDFPLAKSSRKGSAQERSTAIDGVLVSCPTRLRRARRQCLNLRLQLSYPPLCIWFGMMCLGAQAILSACRTMLSCGSTVRIARVDGHRRIGRDETRSRDGSHGRHIRPARIHNDVVDP